MLYQNTHIGKWNLKEHRYWCDCDHPSHVLCLVQDGYENKVEMLLTIDNNQTWSLWRRIKEAIKLIFNGKVSYAEILIGQEDRKELAYVIEHGHIETEEINTA
jgi:hypothetical protein